MNETDSRTRNVVNDQVLMGGHFDDSLGFECFSKYGQFLGVHTNLATAQLSVVSGLSDATNRCSDIFRHYLTSCWVTSAVTSIKAHAPKENTLTQFTDMVKTWKQALQVHHFTGLISRLEFIFEDEPELGPKQKEPSPESFSALLAYMATKPEYKTPSISYNRDGSFSASWQAEKKMRLTLDFIGLTRICWVFVDSRQGLEQVISGAGIVPNNMLQGILESYGGLEWMRR